MDYPYSFWSTHLIHTKQEGYIPVKVSGVFSNDHAFHVDSVKRTHGGQEILPTLSRAQITLLEDYGDDYYDNAVDLQKYDAAEARIEAAREL